MPDDLSKMSLAATSPPPDITQLHTDVAQVHCTPTDRDAAKLAMWPELVATLSRADDLLSVCDLDSDAEALATIRDMLARARELDDDDRRAATASRLPTDADLAAIATDVEPME